MNDNTHSVRRWLILLLSVGLMALAVWRSWPQPREVVYTLYRERGKARTVAGLEGYDRLSSRHFELYYTKSDRSVAPMILETAELIYEPVVSQIGFRPPDSIPLILYPDRKEMRTAFGWGSNTSAMGVYWTGTIRLLSPNVWLAGRTESEKHRAFFKLNPIAHELTHYVLDYMTHGNYPRWFTEGLAQWVEYNITGFLWIESESTLNQPLYSLEELESHFDRLQNQPLAYRQSLLLIEYMVDTYGREGLDGVVDQLRVGVPFNRAVKQVLDTDMPSLYQAWLGWVEQHHDELEARQ